MRLQTLIGHLNDELKGTLDKSNRFGVFRAAGCAMTCSLITAITKAAQQPCTEGQVTFDATVEPS